MREDAEWLKKPALPDEELLGISTRSVKIYTFLKDKGASFFNDIARFIPGLPYEIEESLGQLLCAGLITADDFDNVRALLSSKRRKSRHQGLRHSPGRWSVLSLQDNEACPQTQVEAAARLLLKRYGVVFRDLLKREKNMPPWRDLLLCLRRLEDRGEVRGGRFVSSFMGEQFALPEAALSLRAHVKSPTGEQVFHLSAADPLNLAGIIVPGPRIAPRTAHEIQIKQGKIALCSQ